MRRNYHPSVTALNPQDKNHKKLGLTPGHALQIIINLKQHNIILRHSLLVVPLMRRVIRDLKPFLAEMWVDYVDPVQVCWCNTAVVADGEGGVGVCASDTAPYAIRNYQDPS